MNTNTHDGAVFFPRAFYKTINNLMDTTKVLVEIMCNFDTI